MVLEADQETRVETFVSEFVGEGALLWHEDAEEALSGHLTLAEVGVVEDCHVHVSLCPSVEVKVRFNGVGDERTFSPAVTVGSVLKTVGGPEGFKLTDSELAKHELVPCGTQSGLDESVHIGSAADGNCSACLDLVAKERIQG